MAAGVVTSRKIKCHEISHERRLRVDNMYDVIAEFSLVRENEQKGGALRWKGLDIEGDFSGSLPWKTGAKSFMRL